MRLFQAAVFLLRRRARREGGALYWKRVRGVCRVHTILGPFSYRGQGLRCGAGSRRGIIRWGIVAQRSRRGPCTFIAFLPTIPMDSMKAPPRPFPSFCDHAHRGRGAHWFFPSDRDCLQAGTNVANTIFVDAFPVPSRRSRLIPSMPKASRVPAASSITRRRSTSSWITSPKVFASTR